MGGARFEHTRRAQAWADWADRANAGAPNQTLADTEARFRYKRAQLRRVHYGVSKTADAAENTAAACEAADRQISKTGTRHAEHAVKDVNASASWAQVKVPNQPAARRRASKTKKVAAAARSRSRTRLQQACEDFASRRGRRTLRLLVIGSQHHGKSSFVNHLNRCLRAEYDLPDELETAPAGPSENTLETKTITIPLGTFTFPVTDTPALSSMMEGNAGTLETWLANGVPEGVRRQSSRNAQWPWSEPADAAIICVSLPHWQSTKSEVSELLKAFSRKLKHASGARVSFPYVVVLTKQDEFLEQCQSQNPSQNAAFLLLEIKREIRECANTEKVFVVGNLKEGAKWSAETEEETYRLLTSLATFAKNQNTSRVKEERGKLFRILLFVALLVLLFSVVALRWPS